MRDHTKLRAFELADQFALLVYKHTETFPREEQFGLTSQVRRAAVSIPSKAVRDRLKLTTSSFWTLPMDQRQKRSTNCRLHFDLAF